MHLFRTGGGAIGGARVNGRSASCVGQLLRIFVGADALWQGQPVHLAILTLLRDRGFAGASVFAGIEGFGSHGEIHFDRLFASDRKRSMLVEIIDTEERISAIRPQLEAMIDEGTITLERIEYVHYLSSR
jgi:PII-like signaling protein